jgi:phage tail sheath protein FI
MPAALTYPGVYIEEIPSGVRTITGVATSVAAFVGRTARGPTDVPVVITSWDEFVRNFGGLDLAYPLGFAVRDFYLNGGVQAVIARVFKEQAGSESAPLSAKGLLLQAVSPGSWANGLRVRVTQAKNPDDLKDLATQLNVQKTDFFNLDVHDATTGVTESFLNLTTVPSARNVTGVLLTQSTLVRTKAGALTFPTGVHADLDPTKDTWKEDTLSTGVDGPEAAKVKDSDKLAAAADFGDDATGTGLGLLAQADLFNLLCIPPDTLTGTLPAGLPDIAAAYCTRRRALFIVDPPDTWTTAASVTPAKITSDIAIGGPNARNAALYFPRVIEPNPLHGGQPEAFVPCGAIAGVMARTDVTRGVWKAPAGIDASLTGVLGLSVPLNDNQNGLINPLGVNCLRSFPIIGNIVWGARTLRGADILGDEYKYVPVRRTALFIEESLFRGLKWVVFEPNDEPLWGQIRLNVGAFMQGLFRQGAFQGTSARDAYFVKCDKDTTTQSDINLGIVNVVVGFAPLKPAEFVVLKIQQMAGQIQT